MDKSNLGMNIEWRGENAEMMAIVAVDPEGIAGAGGFLAGDVITKMGGVAPNEFVRNTPRVGSVRVELLRNGVQLVRYLEFPSASDPKPEPQAQPKPVRDRGKTWIVHERCKTILGQLAQPASDAFDRILTAVARLQNKLSRTMDDIVPGIGAAFSGLEKSLEEPDDIDAARIDREFLLRFLYNFDAVAKNFERISELICNATEPQEDHLVSVEEGGQTVIECIRIFARIFNGAKPPPEPRPFVGAISPYADAPLMSNTASTSD